MIPESTFASESQLPFFKTDNDSGYFGWFVWKLNDKKLNEDTL